MFDYVVIGKGLMGSAAARYLSQSGAKVAIIGQTRRAREHCIVDAASRYRNKVRHILSCAHHCAVSRRAHHCAVSWRSGCVWIFSRSTARLVLKKGVGSNLRRKRQE